MRHRKYRLYLDLHAGGSLWHAMADLEQNWALSAEEGRNSSEYLPEEYVWYVIRALAEACMVLRNGTTDDQAIEGWRPITHLDFQLTNVLLDLKKRNAPEAGATRKGKERASAPPGPRIAACLPHTSINYY